jgi:hypothetical protein
VVVEAVSDGEGRTRGEVSVGVDVWACSGSDDMV